MPETDRAVVYQAPYEPPDVFQFREYPVPEPVPGCLLIKMTLANICGSDMHGYLGESRNRDSTEPRHQGHEGTGTVAALGEGVTTDVNGAPLAIGDRVIFGHFYYCRRCRACVAGKEWCCPTRRVHMNATADQWPYFRGTFGDYHYLFPSHTVIKTPPELSDELVAGVNCAMTQVYGGLDVAGQGLGEYVVIQDAGGLGLYATAIARERVAGKIIVIDGVQERLDLALELGANDIVDMRELKTPEQRIARVKELTDGWSGEVVVEVVGYPAVVEIGSRSPHLSYTAYPEQWVSGNVTIHDNNNWARKHFLGAIDLLQRTRDTYPSHKIVSHKLPLEQVNEAFAEQHTGHVTRASLVP